MYNELEKYRMIVALCTIGYLCQFVKCSFETLADDNTRELCEKSCAPMNIVMCSDADKSVFNDLKKVVLVCRNDDGSLKTTALGSWTEKRK